MKNKNYKPKTMNRACYFKFAQLSETVKTNLAQSSLGPTTYQLIRGGPYGYALSVGSVYLTDISFNAGYSACIIS